MGWDSEPRGLTMSVSSANRLGSAEGVGGKRKRPVTMRYREYGPAIKGPNLHVAEEAHDLVQQQLTHDAREKRVRRPGVP